MPIFPPNKGFKMPGVGSKNIDSPGNFRDEQHVDKVGYCDATEDSMLPELSNPLKARYTTSGYRKDLKEVDIDVPNKCPKGSKLVDGKCVESEDKPPKNKSKGKDPFQKYIKELLFQDRPYFESDYLNGLTEHLDACNFSDPSKNNTSKYLIIEDEGTKGITGDTVSPDRDWEGFFWKVGSSEKPINKCQTLADV